MRGEFAGRRLHLIGIGGAGMSGLALMAKELGAEVTGSDRAGSSYTEMLEAAGVSVRIGHDAAALPDSGEVVVSTAIPDDNPELAAARERGITVLHRSELLAEIAALKPLCITVAGSHGKTTTTAMIAHVLDQLGLKPSYYVGGEVAIGARSANAHFGSGEIFVLEADESDGSFLRYRPQIAVVTNIEFEHPETWSGFDQLIDAFHKHVAGARTVVISAAQPRSDELELGDRARTFAISPQTADYVAERLSTPGDPTAGTTFSVAGVDVHLAVRGEHNVVNALAALAALDAAGVDIARAAAALGGFHGVARRFERIGTTQAGALVYDDYAHHPTEVTAALETARGSVGGGRLIAVHQPHLFSRTTRYRREFAEALALADLVVVLDIYPARELQQDYPGVSGWMVATDLADAMPGQTVHYAPQLEDAELLLNRILRAGDLCLTLGPGSVTQVAHGLVGNSA